MDKELETHASEANKLLQVRAKKKHWKFTAEIGPLVLREIPQKYALQLPEIMLSGYLTTIGKMPTKHKLLSTIQGRHVRPLH